MSIPDVFDDFFLAQGSTFANDEGQLREAVSMRTTLLKRWLASGSVRFSGGADIRSRIQTSEHGLTHAWGPDDIESPSQPQVTSEIIAQWRFIRTPAVWDDPAILLNNSHNSDKERRIAMFNLKRQIERQATMDMVMTLERMLLAAPDVAMESAASGGSPTSLGVFISENTNTVPTGFTTIQNINPATKTNWQNQKLAYDGANAEAATGDFLFILSKMSRLCHYEGLPIAETAASKANLPAAIYTSINGVGLLEEAMRNKQDMLVYVGRQDPTYPKPTIHGIPVEWIDYLTTAPMYPTGAAGVYSYEGNTAGTTNAGPRFNFVNFDTLKLFFHSERFFYKYPITSPDGQPSRKICYIDTYVNALCEGRREQGVVYPSSDVDAAFRS